MKLGFYNEFRPCVIKEGGVVDLTGLLGAVDRDSPQAVLERLIVNFESLRPEIEGLQDRAAIIPWEEVRLRAPVPRPGKVLCGERNFMEGVPLTPAGPLRTFFKSPDAVIGPGDTVVLPSFRPTIFNHEAELAVVIGREAKDLQPAEALEYVFGYTTAVDVSARAPAENEAGLPGSYGKSFDTFLPIGPAITTAEEIDDPNNLRVRYWVNEELRQDYNTSDMEHGVAFLVATLSYVMTLKPGDLLLAGTNHGRLGPLQNGDFAEIEIEKIGRNTHYVEDALERRWDEHALRDPRTNAERREAMRGQPHPGTWPFQPAGGGE